MTLLDSVMLGAQVLSRVLPEAAPAAVGPDTAGVVIELVQGETGVHPLPVELVQEIRAAC